MGNGFCAAVAIFYNTLPVTSRFHLWEIRSKAVESRYKSVLRNLILFAMATVSQLRKPVAAATVLSRRKRIIGFGILLTLGIAGALAYFLAGCGGGSSVAPPPPPPPVAFQALTAAEV